jgi:hypothetical protein
MQVTTYIDLLVLPPGESSTDRGDFESTSDIGCDFTYRFAAGVNLIICNISSDLSHWEGRTCKGERRTGSTKIRRDSS